MKQIAIIGGGAAGLAAAISAARTCTAAETPVRIVIFEATDRVGKSILASGNGRCNFSNSEVLPERYHHADFVAESMTALPSKEVLSFFADLGLLWREESEGRLYPVTNKANSVLDVLRFAARDAGVEILCSKTIHAITPARDKFLILNNEDSAEFFDAVVMACGGKAARHLLPPTYPYLNTQPVLGPLKTDLDAIRGLNNVRAQCEVRCEICHEDPDEAGKARREVFCEQGEVLFRDYGVSGIVIFNLSRHARPGDRLVLDLLPSVGCDAIVDMFANRFTQLKGRSALEFLAGMMQQPLARAVLRAAGIDAEKVLEAEDLPALGATIKEFTLNVQGIEDPRQCQVQRGGFAVDAWDPASMGSNYDTGLFIAGEALDIDGPCGGFNLHWAWTSGILAGRAAAHSIS